jgi:hypothetical protein|nr:MAG TPA: hypothetical protein [Caudoviricetes sp.]
MKIVDAKPPKSKSAQFRDIARQISGKDKAAFFQSEGDFKMFCQLARSLGLKPRSKKLQNGGWYVWC